MAFSRVWMKGALAAALALAACTTGADDSPGAVDGDCASCVGGWHPDDASAPGADGSAPGKDGASTSDGAACAPGSTRCADAADGGQPPPPSTGALPRLVAYVNCMCGFGVGPNGGACLSDPDPNVNHVESWETAGTSPITHYVISFLSFSGGEIQTDPGEIWANGGGHTDNFTLHDLKSDNIILDQNRN